jgi:hypothetical protein
MVEVIKRWARFAITLQAAYATLWRGISSALLSERNASLIRPIDGFGARALTAGALDVGHLKQTFDRVISF